MADNNSWLDKNLGAQLLSRLMRPGVVEIGMGQTIAARMAQTVHPLPLLDDLETRWQSVFDMQDDALPLVLAQPAQSGTNHSWPQKQSDARGSQAKQKPMPIVTPKRAKAAPQETPLIPNPKAGVQTNGKQAFVPPANAKGETKTAVSKPTLAANPQTAPTSSTAPIATKTKGGSQTTASNQKSTPVIASTSSNEPNTAVSALPIVRPKQTAVQPTNAARKNTPLPTMQAPSAQGNKPKVDIPSAIQAVSPKGTKTKAQASLTMRSTFPAALPQNKPLLTPDTQSVDKPALPVVKPKRVANSISQRYTPAPKTAVQFPTVSPKVTGNTQSTSTSPAKPSSPLPLVHVPNSEPPSRRHSVSLPLPTRKATTPMPATPSASPASTSSFSAPSARPSVGVSSNVIQRDADITEGEAQEPATDMGNTAVDIDEIVAEVHRQFKRELAIEGERRGVVPWQ